MNPKEPSSKIKLVPERCLCIYVLDEYEQSAPSELFLNGGQILTDRSIRIINDTIAAQHKYEDDIREFNRRCDTARLAFAENKEKATDLLLGAGISIERVLRMFSSADQVTLLSFNVDSDGRARYIHRRFGLEYQETELPATDETLDNFLLTQVWGTSRSTERIQAQPHMIRAAPFRNLDINGDDIAECIVNINNITPSLVVGDEFIAARLGLRFIYFGPNDISQYTLDSGTYEELYTFGVRIRNARRSSIETYNAFERAILFGSNYLINRNTYSTYSATEDTIFKRNAFGVSHKDIYSLVIRAFGHQPATVDMPDVIPRRIYRVINVCLETRDPKKFKKQIFLENIIQLAPNGILSQVRADVNTWYQQAKSYNDGLKQLNDVRVFM